MQQELPYEPLTFIKTGTIGGSSKETTSSLNFDFKHHHIVQPKCLPSPKLVLYLLFHSAPIYNWLITVPTLQTSLLSQYIIDSQPCPLTLTINPKAIIQNLQEYSKRWEVVRLVFGSSVYINQVRQHGSQACTHLAKTQQFTVELSYDKGKGQLYCPSIVCKDCGRTVNVQSKLKESSPAFVSTFSAPSLVTKTGKYEAWIVFSKKRVFIRAANKIWYAVDLSTGNAKIIGINNVEFREAQLAGYCLEGKEEQGALVKALPIKDQILKRGKEPQISKQDRDEEKPKHQLQQEQGNNGSASKERKQKQVVLRLAGKVKPLKYDPTKVVLSSDTLSSGYIKQVQSLLSKPKQKDSYELEYDRGKLKKKKEKKQYIQPDFNQVFEQVKKKGGVDLQSKKIKKQPKKGSHSDSSQN